MTSILMIQSLCKPKKQYPCKSSAVEFMCLSCCFYLCLGTSLSLGFTEPWNDLFGSQNSHAGARRPRCCIAVTAVCSILNFKNGDDGAVRGHLLRVCVWGIVLTVWTDIGLVCGHAHTRVPTHLDDLSAASSLTKACNLHVCKSLEAILELKQWD